MRLSTMILALAGTAVAVPTEGSLNLKRAAPDAIVDQLMFGITLPQFTARRNKKDPSTADWTSDGCTSSPDNPFGFPFLQACHRHDFGYHNFRAGNRFTKANKAKIDQQFQTDLYSQCNQVFALTVCKKLADVYFVAVTRLGGGDATKREQNEKSEIAYQAAVVAYEKAIEEAQEQGLLPVLSY